MDPKIFTEITRLARIGALHLGQSATPATMQQAWSVIGEAEKAVQAAIDAQVQPQPAAAPAA